MQAYIGCKIILAEKCCKQAFDAAKARRSFGSTSDFDWEEPQDERVEVVEGYHVVYSNPDGSKYHSWSPKDVFERSYRSVETDEKELISTY